MAQRILLCGMNGAGKSTLARWLSEHADIRRMDVEDYYFEPRGDDPFGYQRPREEVCRLLEGDLRVSERVVLAAVKADYGPGVVSLLTGAVHLIVPKVQRMARVRARSQARFGARMLPGGDLHRREEEFFRIVEAREEDAVRRWLESSGLPVLRLDGTRPVEENGRAVLAAMAHGDLQNRLEHANIEGNPGKGGFFA